MIPVALEKQAEETLTERGSRWLSETGNKGKPLTGAGDCWPLCAPAPLLSTIYPPEAAAYK